MIYCNSTLLNSWFWIINLIESDNSIVSKFSSFTSMALASLGRISSKLFWNSWNSMVVLTEILSEIIV